MIGVECQLKAVFQLYNDVQIKLSCLKICPVNKIQVLTGRRNLLVIMGTGQKPPRRKAPLGQKPPWQKASQYWNNYSILLHLFYIEGDIKSYLKELIQKIKIL